MQVCSLHNIYIYLYSVCAPYVNFISWWGMGWGCTRTTGPEQFRQEQGCRGTCLPDACTQGRFTGLPRNSDEWSQQAHWNKNSLWNKSCYFHISIFKSKRIMSQAEICSEGHRLKEWFPNRRTNITGGTSAVTARGCVESLWRSWINLIKLKLRFYLKNISTYWVSCNSWTYSMCRNWDCKLVSKRAEKLNELKEMNKKFK